MPTVIRMTRPRTRKTQVLFFAKLITFADMVDASYINIESEWVTTRFWLHFNKALPLLAAGPVPKILFIREIRN